MYSDVQTVREAMRSGRLGTPETDFRVLKALSRLARIDGGEEVGRELLIRAIDRLEASDAERGEYWDALLDSYGLYPYSELANLTGGSTLRHAVHQSESLSNIVFHRDQLAAALNLYDSKSLVLSAPTSFGKSLLIEEVVASERYANIAVIQPTLALLDETRKKLRQYSNYNIVVSTHQKPRERNIFLLTAERAVDYPWFDSIDFFVIDEFYKLSLERDDERAVSLNHAFQILRRYTNFFFLLGPAVKAISKQFLEDTGAEFHRSNYATVAVDVHPVYEGKGWKKKDPRRDAELERLLASLHDPALIYCASRQRVERACREMAHSRPASAVPRDSTLQNTIEWVRENIHPEWSLAECLERRLAFHHGSLPRHLGSTLVDLFNQGQIDFLFCTSTLIEGVNTAAKSVVLFDKTKGNRKPIDFFDFKNIAGRSGRMGFHKVGNVYQFHPEPEQVELDVSVPLFEQELAPLELLVQLDEHEVQEAGEEALVRFNTLDRETREIIKANKGIPVDGQISFLEELEKNSVELHDRLSWTSVPRFEELDAVLTLCWSFFLKPGESKHEARTSRQLAFLTLKYYEQRSLRWLISDQVDSEYWASKVPDSGERVSVVSAQVLAINKGWFDFKLPKYLSAANYLQKFFFERQGMRPGNYSYFASALENSMLPEGISALKDYDIPASALRKIMSRTGVVESVDEAIEKVRRLDLYAAGLNGYEAEKVRDGIGLQ